MKRDELKKLLDDQEVRLTRHLDEQLAKFFGKFSDHFDQRFNKLESRLDEKIERIEQSVDAIAGRVTTDEQERAAIVVEQKRHQDWIGQLAKSTGTKLVPEQ